VTDFPELLNSLTEREREVLDYASRGMTNKQIGATLFISSRTVQGHLQHVFEKLGVGTRTEAVALMLQYAETAMVRDVVCGRMIDPAKAFAVREKNGQQYFFCCPLCLKEFDADPDRYLAAT
jgi:DNA-binding CsgD family transcriptional regulator/YHS domain-containing protein